MLSFTCRCFVFPLSPGGVTYLASTTAAVFTSPGEASRLTCSGIQDLLILILPPSLKFNIQCIHYAPLMLSILTCRLRSVERGLSVATGRGR